MCWKKEIEMPCKSRGRNNLLCLVHYNKFLEQTAIFAITLCAGCVMFSSSVLVIISMSGSSKSGNSSGSNSSGSGSSGSGSDSSPVGCSIPDTIDAKHFVRCSTTGDVYAINNGTKRKWNFADYNSAKSQLITTDVDCTSLSKCPDGPEIRLKRLEYYTDYKLIEQPKFLVVLRFGCYRRRRHISDILLSIRNPDIFAE